MFGSSLRIKTTLLLARSLIACCWLLGRSLSFKSYRQSNPSLLWLRSTLTSESIAETRIRELGGYERLLSRKNPGTNKVLGEVYECILQRYPQPPNNFPQSNVSERTNDTCFTLSTLHYDRCLYLMDQPSFSTAMLPQKPLFRLWQIAWKGFNRDETVTHPMMRAYISKDDDLKKEYWTQCGLPNSVLAETVVSTIEVPMSNFDSTWRENFESNLNDAAFPEKGPLWSLKNFVTDSSPKKSAWVFCFNHGCDDQQSVNIIVKDILDDIYSNANTLVGQAGRTSYPFPKSVEDAVAPAFLSWKTLKWAVFQLVNQAANADVLPQKVLQNYKSDPVKYAKEYANPDNRRTFVEYFTLSREETAALRIVCRSNKVTITNALSACILGLTSEFFQDGFSGTSNTDLKEKDLRFLLSVGLRPFGVKNDLDNDRKHMMPDWTQGTVACASGAVDFVISVPTPQLIRDSDKREHIDFWDLAKRCKEKAKNIIENECYVPESVRLFGFGMKYADILGIVDTESKNPGTMGRGYSCGVSNVGLVSLPVPSSSSTSNDLQIREGYYGTSHARNGVFCLLSSMTVGDIFCGCLQFTSPFISVEEAKEFKLKLNRMISNLI